MAKTLLEAANQAIGDSSFGGGIKWHPKTEAEVQEQIRRKVLELAKKQGITSWQQFAAKVDLPTLEVKAIWNGQFDLLTLERSDKVARGLGLGNMGDIIFEICLETEW